MEIIVFVAGGFFGVVADRIWQRIEQIPRIRIEPSKFQNIHGEDGVQLRVTNLGFASIPAYRVVIRCPSASVVHTDPDGPKSLERYQYNEHRFHLLKNGQPVRDLGLLFATPDVAPAGRRDFSGYTFELVQDRSDNVLFRDAVVGNALARIARHVNLNGTYDGLEAGEFLKLHLEPIGWQKIVTAAQDMVKRALAPVSVIWRKQ